MRDHNLQPTSLGLQNAAAPGSSSVGPASSTAQASIQERERAVGQKSARPAEADTPVKRSRREPPSPAQGEIPTAGQAGLTAKEASIAFAAAGKGAAPSQAAASAQADQIPVWAADADRAAEAGGLCSAKAGGLCSAETGGLCSAEAGGLCSAEAGGVWSAGAGGL